MAVESLQPVSRLAKSFRAPINADETSMGPMIERARRVTARLPIAVWPESLGHIFVSEI